MRTSSWDCQAKFMVYGGVFNSPSHPFWCGQKLVVAQIGFLLRCHTNTILYIMIKLSIFNQATSHLVLWQCHRRTTLQRHSSKTCKVWIRLCCGSQVWGTTLNMREVSSINYQNKPPLHTVLSSPRKSNRDSCSLCSCQTKTDLVWLRNHVTP